MISEAPPPFLESTFFPSGEFPQSCEGSAAISGYSRRVDGASRTAAPANPLSHTTCTDLRPPVVLKESSVFQIMIAPPLPNAGAKLLLSGIHVDLNEATKESIESKAYRLFRHEPRILRIRIDVERTSGGGTWMFTAKGHIEISGPDLMASVTTEDAHKSVNLLIDKLDRMLRKRTTAMSSVRHDDDIRAHADPRDS